MVLLFNASYLLKIPAVWPDEVLFADSALNLLSENRIGTDLYKGIIPGVEKFGWGYPPVYFYTTATWFKAFGFSIYTQRLLSLSLGILFIFLFYKVTKKIIPNQTTAHKFSLLTLLTLVITLLTDAGFVKAIHISRPEIEVLVLGFIALLLYLKSQTKNSGLTFSVTAGLLLSLAFLTHYLAIIFITGFLLHALFLDPRKFLKTKKNYYLFFSFLIPVIGWLLLISGDINYLLNDVTLRLKYKTTTPYWIWIVFSSSTLITKLQYIFYFIITWELFFAFANTKNKNGLLVLLLLILSWFWTYIWQTEYSFIYTIIFVYLGLAFLVFSNLDLKGLDSKIKSKTLLNSVLIMLLFNIWNLVSVTGDLSGENFDYNLYTERVVELIPQNTTVYLSAIPDPYYGFKEKGNYKLYEFPGLPTEKENLTRILDESDYIIFNSPLENLVMEGQSVSYIQANSETITPVGGDFQYRAFVVKLKPKNARTH